MVANRKVTGTAVSMPVGLAMGALLSLALTLAGAITAAHLVSGMIIAEDAIGYCSMVILLAASFAGTALAVNRIKHRKLYVCALSALIYYVCLLGITALFFGGQYQGIGVTGLLILAGAGLVALLGLKQGRSTPRRKSKIRHR